MFDLSWNSCWKLTWKPSEEQVTLYWYSMYHSIKSEMVNLKYRFPLWNVMNYLPKLYRLFGGSPCSSSPVGSWSLPMILPCGCCAFRLWVPDGLLLLVSSFRSPFSACPRAECFVPGTRISSSLVFFTTHIYALCVNVVLLCTPRSMAFCLLLHQCYFWMYDGLVWLQARLWVTEVLAVSTSQAMLTILGSAVNMINNGLDTNCCKWFSLILSTSCV